MCESAGERLPPVRSTVLVLLAGMTSSTPVVPDGIVMLAVAVVSATICFWPIALDAENAGALTFNVPSRRPVTDPERLIVAVAVANAGVAASRTARAPSRKHLII